MPAQATLWRAWLLQNCLHLHACCEVTEQLQMADAGLIVHASRASLA